MRDRKRYLIVHGDTLSEIAAKFSIPMGRLVAWNRIKNPDLIYAGHALWLVPPEQQCRCAA